MTSSSTLGVCSVTLQFDLSRDVDGAARDVEAAINAARTYLPTNLPANPQYRKINSALAPVMVLDLTSPTRSKAQLYDTASSVIQQKLSQVEGVGQVQVVGSSLPAVRIDANPQQLNSYGLGLQDLARVISQQNSNRPKGQISDDFTTASPDRGQQRSGGGRPDARCCQRLRLGADPARRRLRQSAARHYPARVPPSRRQCDRDGRSHQGDPSFGARLHSRR
jgi:multidrug efflux pump